MVHCKKCNKVISNTDDLNVVPGSNLVKTDNYCNACAGELSKKRGGFRNPLNNKYVLKRYNLVPVFFIPVFILLGLGLFNDPENFKIWIGLGLAIFFFVTLKKRRAKLQRTIEEVRNTPEARTAKKEVAETSSSLKCAECSSVIPSRDKAYVVRKGFSIKTKTLCNTCYFKQIKNKSPFGLSSYSFPVLVNTRAYKLITIVSTLALFVLVGFLVFDRNRPDEFQIKIGAIFLFFTAVTGWISIINAKSRLRGRDF